MKPTAEIISESGDEVVIQVTVRKSTCFAECEEVTIQVPLGRKNQKYNLYYENYGLPCR